MGYIQSFKKISIFIGILASSFAYSAKNENQINVKQVWPGLAGLLAVGVWSGCTKIGPFTINATMRTLGIVPSFYLGSKIFSSTMNVSHTIKNGFIKINQK